MNLKKKVLMLTSVVLVLGLASLGIMAYLTDQESKTNVFTVGDIDITLEEEVDVIGEGEVDDVTDNDGNITGAAYSGIMPGDKLQKEVTVENTGSNDAYVRVIVTLNNALEINNAIDEYYEDKGYTPEQIQAVYDEVFDGWGLNYTKEKDGKILGMRLTITGDDMPAGVEHVDSVKTIDEYWQAYSDNWFANEKDKNKVIPFEGYYTGEMDDFIAGMEEYQIRYAYYAYLKPGDEIKLFDGLNVPRYFDADQLAMFDGLEIDVKAEAIQAANIGTGKEKADFVRAFELFVNPTAPKSVTTIKELKDAIANNDPACLSEDVASDEGILVDENKAASINLNEKSLTVNYIENIGDLEVSNGTVEADYINNYGDATFTDVEIKAGSPTDYACISQGDGETVYEDVDVISGGGGVAAANGAKVTFESGKVYVDTASTSGRYLFYTEGAGSEITINGGTFSWDPADNQKRAYIYAGKDTTVYVNGGTFGKASTRSGYTAGILGEGTVIIKGGTFGFNPTKWVAEGYEAVKDGSVWNVVAK